MGKRSGGKGNRRAKMRELGNFFGGNFFEGLVKIGNFIERFINIVLGFFPFNFNIKKLLQ